MRPPRQTGQGPLLRRVGFIGLTVLAMFQLVVMLRPGPATEDDFRSVATVEAPDAGKPIKAEAGAFRDLREGRLNVGEADASPHVLVPSRVTRSRRRAYDGAPPAVPHELAPDIERGQDCAPCHTFGGYNPGLRTYSPRSPHPELGNCMQCHVRPQTSGTFVASDWVTPDPPAYGEGGTILGAPPAIPHTLVMREHCVSCHGGASAAPDIRTDHPERFNCRQCHAAIEAPGEVFERPPPGADS